VPIDCSTEWLHSRRASAASIHDADCDDVDDIGGWLYQFYEVRREKKEVVWPRIEARAYRRHPPVTQGCFTPAGLDRCAYPGGGTLLGRPVVAEPSMSWSKGCASTCGLTGNIEGEPETDFLKVNSYLGPGNHHCPCGAYLAHFCRASFVSGALMLIARDAFDCCYDICFFLIYLRGRALRACAKRQSP